MVSFIVLWLSAAQIFILFFWCVYYTHLTLGILKSQSLNNFSCLPEKRAKFQNTERLILTIVYLSFQTYS